MRLVTIKCLLVIALASGLSGQMLTAHPGDEAALGYLDHQLQQYPTAENYLQRASIYLRHGDLYSAEKDIAAAESLGNFIQATLLRSELLTLQNRPDDAINQLDELLHEYPGMSAALQQRARLFLTVGREKEAAQDYHQLLRTTRSVGPGLYLEAAQIFAIAEGFESALAALDSGMEQLGMTVALQRPAINYCLQAGRFEAAILRQLQLREVMAKSPLWRIEMAEVYWQAGKVNAAQVQLQELKTTAEQMRQSPGLRAVLERAQLLDTKMSILQI